jgi:type I restriction enzyme S subunit
MKSTHFLVPLSVEAKAPNPPAGWTWTLLTTVAQLESGHTPSRRHPEWWGGEIPWISLPDIRFLDGKVALETVEYINQDGIRNSSARILPKDTVVLSRTASVGFVTIMGRSMATSQDFVNWICGKQLDPWFLLYVLMASRNYIRSLASGSVHKTVYMPTVKSFRICLPSLDIQRDIVSRLRGGLSAAERARAALLAQLEAYERLPAALLRSTFSGHD